VVELSFSRPEFGNNMEEVEVSAQEILSHANLLQNLQGAVPELRVRQIVPEVSLKIAVKQLIGDGVSEWDYCIKFVVMALSNAED
jgi:hypothetical protein